MSSYFWTRERDRYGEEEKAERKKEIRKKRDKRKRSVDPAWCIHWETKLFARWYEDWKLFLYIFNNIFVSFGRMSIHGCLEIMVSKIIIYRDGRNSNGERSLGDFPRLGRYKDNLIPNFLFEKGIEMRWNPTYRS